jgi:hypothetical protein
MKLPLLFVCLISPMTFAAAATAVIDAQPEEALSALRDRARRERRSATQPVTIRLPGGTRTLTEPLVLGPEDSYTTWEAKAGETPILSGGRKITGWRNAKFNGEDCWAADVPGVKKGGYFFRELWVDGKRATRARQPNRGHYLKVKDSPDATANWEQGVSRFVFDGDDIPAGPFAYRAEAIVMSRWVEARMPIMSVDAAAHLASFTRKSQWRIEPRDRYWLEGDPRWFDEPGEFYLDHDAGTAYYLPLPGQQIDKIEAVAPSLAQLVKLNGKHEQGKFIENATFRGIAFAHTHWMLPDPDPATTQPTSGGFMQAAIPVPAAVSGQGLRRVNFERCTFANMGTWGLELGRASQHCLVSHCTFRDLGGGGIKLGGDSISQRANDQSFGNEIADCEIAEGGNVFPSAVGVWVGQAFDNRITHNHIHDLFYSGVSVGWTWGYDDSLNRGNIIEHNHIHHIGQRADGDGPILADMGAIYLLGGRIGTVVRDNHLHDINGVRIAWGVYLDEGCCDVRVQNNLIHHTSHGAFHLHYGRDNIVRNNVFALGREVQMWRSREEEHNSFTFERNVVYWGNGSPLITTSPKNVKFDHNAYGGIAEKDFRAGSLTWERWRAAGEDAHSVLIPGRIFVDAEKGDFGWVEDVEGRIGFVPLNWDDVGPRRPLRR